MKKRLVIATLISVIAVSSYFLVESEFHKWSPIVSASPSPKPPSACAFPTAPAGTPQQTAWQLFVAANCPANDTQVVWETWIEQLQLYPASGTATGPTLRGRAALKRLHGSPLARAEAARSGGVAPLLEPGVCPTVKPANAPPNLAPSATICEEARLNPQAASFVTGHGYQIRSGQTTAAQNGTDIEFPDPAIEVKVDWMPATDFNPPFTCSNPLQGVHVETIDGVCYVMAGMHISSKLLKNWLWATFEPQSMVTNPLRCVTFGPCNDSWGSNPAASSGGTGGLTKQTADLTTLMKQANLAPEFFNYRLDGVQTDFTKPDGTSTYLGNSIIEGENVGLKLNHASCITCHSVSSIKNDGTDGFSTFINLHDDPVGAQYRIPNGWVARDFVWSLAFACPAGQGMQPCNSPAGAMKKTK